MVIVYDPSLEGTALPTLNDVSSHVRIRQKLDAKTQKYLKEFLVKTKNLEGIEYDVDSTDGEEKFNAFMKALQVIGRWMNDEDNPSFKMPDGRKLDIKANGIGNFLKHYKAVAWIEDQNGNRHYYTLAYLNRINFNNIADVFTNILSMQDDYQGLNEADIVNNNTVHIPNRMGLLWFSDGTRGTVIGPANRVRNNAVNIDMSVEHPSGVRTRQYNRRTGAFFPYKSNIPIDLTPLQIYCDIKPEYYKHNCFVYACIQSGVFSNEEIEFMCKLIITRNLPKKDIKHIAEALECNFKVYHVDETKPLRNQISVDTNTEKILKKTYDRSVNLYLYKNHYFIAKKLPITLFYIKNAEEINEKYKDLPLADRMRICRIGKKKPTLSDTLTNPLTLLREMFKLNRFTPIDKMDESIISTTEYNRRLIDYDDLSYDDKLCCRLCSNKKRSSEFDYIIYADFESDITVNPHQAYLCCAVWEDNGILMKKVFRGFDCGTNFINWCPNKSLIYFHNLKYDASFFMNVKPNDYHVRVIERSGNLLQVQFRRLRDGKTMIFRNSYSIIPAALKQFASMFNLEVHKEICPYHVYTKENIKKKWIPLEECIDDIKSMDLDPEEFTNAAKEINCLKDNTVDIMGYSEYYCLKDCQVLYKGMVAFNRDMGQLFEDSSEEWIGLENYLSVSSIGYHFALTYGCMEGCYELSGKPQDFISRCVSGGRTMCANNEKIIIEKKLQDFDAVSLYPSAMYIMNGIPKGIPKVLSTKECEEKSFLNTVDDYFIEINITKLQAKGVDHYRFPLVFEFENGSKIYRDKCYKNFYIDKRGLEDLIEFYDIEYEVLRGYYFDEGYNNKINEFIKKLFDLRKKYKEEGNPLQNTIKLLLNSIYGKSILKPIDTDISVVNPNKFERWVIQNYNFIKSATSYIGKDGTPKHIYAKLIKPINNHFNLPQFGVNVLSWSKHIMNEVMCLADQEHLEVYYQDTDSLHIGEEDVPKLAKAFKERYGRELIGKDLCQFHCDFNPIVEGIPVHSKKLIALGKKSYIDCLEDDEGNTGYHIRMKGIPQNVIMNYCQEKEITLEELYMQLYNGEYIVFNLLNGANCFRKNKFYEQYTPEVFLRKVHF